MASLNLTAEEFAEISLRVCESPTEETLSLCSSDQESEFIQTASVYPSPYRASASAAFADINRALAVRSLRESVLASPYASHLSTQAYPRSNTRPLSTIYATDIDAPSDKARNEHPSLSKPSDSSKSLPNSFLRAPDLGNGQEEIPRTNQRPTLRMSASLLAMGLGKKKSKRTFSCLKESAPNNERNTYKAMEGEEAAGGMSANKKQSSRSLRRATTCITM